MAKSAVFQDFENFSGNMLKQIRSRSGVSVSDMIDFFKKKGGNFAKSKDGILSMEARPRVSPKYVFAYRERLGETVFDELYNRVKTGARTA